MAPPGSCDQTLERRRMFLFPFCSFHWSYLNVILRTKPYYARRCAKTLAALLFVVTRISLETFPKTSSANSFGSCIAFPVNGV